MEKCVDSNLYKFVTNKIYIYLIDTLHPYKTYEKAKHNT